MNKKVISVLMSVVLFISLLMPFSAFAGIKNDELKKQVEDDIQGELTYLNFTPSLSQAVSSQMLFRVDDSKKDVFLTELDTNLAQNGGKVVVNGSENVVYYAAIINILDLLGEDITDYKGYDFVDLFLNCPNTTVENPYYVMQVVEACWLIGEDALAHNYIDTLISERYTPGQGMDYYGFSADNNGMFVATVGLYKEDYQDYIDDVLPLIEAQKKENGYDSGWGVTASTTSCVLLAYTVIGDEEKATEAYKLLVDNFESSENNGVMQYDGADDSYATSQAIRSLSYYIELFDDSSIDDSDDNGNQDETDDKKDTGSSSQTKTDVKKDDTKKSPNTGAATGFTFLGLGAVALAVSRRKK